MGDPDFSDCNSCAFAALWRAGRDLTRFYERRFHGTKMRAGQFTILAALAGDAGAACNLTQLAALLGMERTTLNRNLRSLQARGWVRSAWVRADQRVRRIELTQPGLAAAAKALPNWRRAQREAGSLLQRHGIRIG